MSQPPTHNDDAEQQQPEQQQPEQAVAQEADLEALLDSEENNNNTTSTAADDQQDAAVAADEEQQQVQFVWTACGADAEGNPIWLPAVYCGQNDDGSYAVSYAEDINQIYSVATVEPISDMADARFSSEEATKQYNELYNIYMSVAAEQEAAAAAGGGDEDKEARRLRKEEKKRKKEEEKRLKKEKKKEKKAAAKKARKAGDDDLISEGDDDDDDDDVSDLDDMPSPGGVAPAVDRMRRGAAGGGLAGFPGFASAGPRTALDNIAAGSSDKMRTYLTQARNLYDETRQQALQRGERMIEFQTDYLAQAKQQRIDQLAVARFVKNNIDKKQLKDMDDNVKGWIKNLEDGTTATNSTTDDNSNNNNNNNNNKSSIPIPLSRRIDVPDHVDRVPRIPPGAPSSSQFTDPLLRAISPPRIEVERRPLALRTFADTQSSTNGTADSSAAAAHRFYVKNPPMKQWRALRDTVSQTPADIQQVPVSGHIAREFNEPRRKLLNKTRANTAKILGAEIQESLTQQQLQNQQRQCNTQFNLFNFTAAALAAPTIKQQQQLTLQGLPSVGPSPSHLGAATPAFSELMNVSNVPSAALSEVGTSQIPVYEEGDLAFHVDPQSLSRGRSEQSHISDISDGSKNRQSNNNNNAVVESSRNSSQSRQRSVSHPGSAAGSNNAPASTVATWKQRAARVISRVLTPYLHGSHGCPMIISDPDEFATIAKDLTVKAYNSKLQQLGLAPELRHAPIPESEFSEQEATHLGSAVQAYMRSRAGRRRGRSSSSSMTGGSDSGTGSTYSGTSGHGSSSAGSSRSGYTSTRSGYSSAVQSGQGMKAPGDTSTYSASSAGGGGGGYSHYSSRNGDDSNNANGNNNNEKGSEFNRL